MNLTPLEKLIIAAAWSALQTVLTALGVPSIVINAIAAVLQHFGLLSGPALSAEEVKSKAEAVQALCTK